MYTYIKMRQNTYLAKFLKKYIQQFNFQTLAVYAKTYDLITMNAYVVYVIEMFMTTNMACTARCALNGFIEFVLT